VDDFELPMKSHTFLSNSRFPTQTCLRLLIATVLLAVVKGQHTEAVCETDYDWTFNSLGQSPCLVAAFLQGSCTGGDFNVPAIDPSMHYTNSDPNPCFCSSVTYSLLSACGVCQGADLSSWDKYATNCTSNDIPISADGQFPVPIPSGTTVPMWAYQLLEKSGTFNINLAKNVSTGGVQMTVANTTATDSSTSETQTSTSSASSPTESNTSIHTSNVGTTVAIAVSVGLGIVLIGGIVAFFLIRRRRRREAHRKEFNVAYSAVGEALESKQSFEPFEESPLQKPFDPYEHSMYPTRTRWSKVPPEEIDGITLVGREDVDHFRKSEYTLHREV